MRVQIVRNGTTLIPGTYCDVIFLSVEAQIVCDQHQQTGPFFHITFVTIPHHVRHSIQNHQSHLSAATDVIQQDKGLIVQQSLTCGFRSKMRHNL